MINYRRYDTQIAKGGKSILLEEGLNNRIVLTVGNLAPSMGVTIVLRCMLVALYV